MDKLYKRLSIALAKNKNISDDEIELYEYAIKVVFQGLINIFAIIAIGLLFGMIKECLCLYGVFFVLRKFAGGFHAKNYGACLTSSVLIMIAALFIIKYLEQHSYQVLFACIVIACTILICVFSPIENENKRLSDNEKNFYKFISVGLSITLMAVVLLLMYYNSILIYSVGMGLIITGLLLILTNSGNKPRQKG